MDERGASGDPRGRLARTTWPAGWPRSGYLADDGLATAAFLALRMGRPLFLEGEAGRRQDLAGRARSPRSLGAPLIRLQCYEGLDASQALYDWDFPRQLLHLRAAEAVGGIDDADAVERDLYDRRFLRRPAAAAGARDQRRACCSSTRSTGPTTSSRRSCSRCSATSPSRCPSSAPSRAAVAAAGRRSPATAPARCTTRSSGAASTTGSTTRRSSARSRSSGGGRPAASERLAARRGRGPSARCATQDLLKPPGVAESLDWTEALLALGARELDPDLAAADASARC